MQLSSTERLVIARQFELNNPMPMDRESPEWLDWKARLMEKITEAEGSKLQKLGTVAGTEIGKLFGLFDPRALVAQPYWRGRLSRTKGQGLAAGKLGRHAPEAERNSQCCPSWAVRLWSQ